MQTACAAWIYSGGAHHTSYSQNLSAENLENFAGMAGIEFVCITKDSNLYNLKK
jgi:L-arabinose isomerase